jgi:hypothetical protein
VGAIKFKVTNFVMQTIALEGENSKYVTLGKVANGSEKKALLVYNEKLPASIEVTKTLTATAPVTAAANYAQGNPIFLFKVTKYDTSDNVLASWVDYIEFESGDNMNKSVTFGDLEWGYKYVVTELDTMRYSLSGSNDLTFTLTAESRTAAAAFTNAKINENYLSDTAVAVNRFVFSPGT